MERGACSVQKDLWQYAYGAEYGSHHYKSSYTFQRKPFTVHRHTSPGTSGRCDLVAKDMRPVWTLHAPTLRPVTGAAPDQNLLLPPA